MKVSDLKYAVVESKALGDDGFVETVKEAKARGYLIEAERVVGPFDSHCEAFEYVREQTKSDGDVEWDASWFNIVPMFDPE